MSLKQRPEDRDGFRFRGSCNAINLPATLQARLSPAPRELLATPADLARWLVSAGLATSAPEVTTDNLATARALREAIYVLAGRRGWAQVKAARETLNRIATGPAATPQLQADGSLRLAGSAAALLVTVAQEVVHLFGSDAAKLIRQCQSPKCTPHANRNQAIVGERLGGDRRLPLLRRAVGVDHPRHQWRVD